MQKSLVLLVVLLAGLIIICGCGEGAAPAEDPALDHDHSQGHDYGHEHGEEPYEWSGAFTFEIETYTLHFEESGDPSVEMVFIFDDGDREHSDHMAYHVWEEEMKPVDAGGSFETKANHGYRLTLNPDRTEFTFIIPEAGDYLVYMEHFPSEFNLKFKDSSGEEIVPK